MSALADSPTRGALNQRERGEPVNLYDNSNCCVCCRECVGSAHAVGCLADADARDAEVAA